MTTRVKVITHDWPASVLAFPLRNREPVEGGQYTEIARVDPNSEREFVCMTARTSLSASFRSRPSNEAPHQAGEGGQDGNPARPWIVHPVPTLPSGAQPEGR